jgi:hypothetical protein
MPQAAVVTAARKRRGACGEDEVVASELEEVSIARQGASGNGVVVARRRGVVKRDWNGELKEGSWQGRQQILGRNTEGAGEYL